MEDVILESTLVENENAFLSCKVLCAGWDDNSDPSDTIEWRDPIGEETILW